MNSTPLKLSSVEITDSFISEKEGNQTILSLSRNQIKSISLGRGLNAERPIIEIVIGIAFLVVSVYISWPFFWAIWESIFLHPGYKDAPLPSVAKFSILGLLFVPIGLSFITKALRRRYFLLIETNKDKRKILFYDNLTYYEIRSFLENASKTYGYIIKMQDPELLTPASRGPR